MKVLVTGGAGYIGSHTVRQLVKSGADVTVLDSMVYGHQAAIVDKEVTLVKGDLGDPAVVYPLLVNGKFDAVVHFEHYNDYTAAEIDELWAEREESELTKQLLRENKLPNLARIFTERRYVKEDNLAISRAYLALMKEHGFMNQ